MLHSLLIAFAATASNIQTPDEIVGLQSVPFQQVHIQDHFWSLRQEVNRKSSVQCCLDQLKKTGDLENFNVATAGSRTGRKGYVFQDSDTYKVIEGAADTLGTNPDPVLDKKLDEIIAMISKAQMPSGYIDTYYQVTEPGRQFTNLRDNHELYCAGHLFEAAVAHFNATGKKNLLNVAIKYADLLYTRYGPESGTLGYGGHPELELALVKLSKATNDHRYFALAEKLVKTRGSHFFALEHHTPEQDYDGTYWIDDIPIIQHKEIKGHAVRAAYLMSGATDICLQTDDHPMEKMLDRVWNNAVEKRAFITGGIGPSGSNEGFTVDYDLPNLSAYQETCASVAMSMWGYRMGLLHADAKYFDAVETALYNAMLAGVSLDGSKFFYVNPLASLGNHHRQDWFDCACCPPNVLRTVATLGGYAYAQKGSDVFVNLYLPGRVDLNVSGKKVRFDVQGNYPWDGHIQIKPASDSATSMGLHFRIPAWCSDASLKINGQTIPTPIVKNGYFVVDRTWSKGDVAEINLPMLVQRVEANPMVKEDIGRLAVRRGPLIYCVEAVDQNSPVSEMVLPRDAKLKVQWRADVLGGVNEIVGSADRVSDDSWSRKLYQPIGKTQSIPITMIPYCDWDNRKAGAMEVWLPTVPPPARVGGPEIHAKVVASFIGSNAQPDGINDGIEPKASNEAVNRLMHFWPHKGTAEWVEYQWAKPISVSGVKVYWFDDTGRGECKLPQSWRLESLVGGKWVPIMVHDYPIQMDKWSEISFPALSTTALRLRVQLKPGWAAGVRQWKVLQDEE